MSTHPSLTAPMIKVVPLKPVETMDVYKPCWCGSGKKYKWCHHKRVEQPKINVFEIEARMHQELLEGYCSHPDPAADPCSPSIIKAHTVQRKGGLALVSEDGHVLTVKPTMKGLIGEEGTSWPRPMGVTKASSFPGFCNHHDTSLFKSVEGGDIAFTAYTAFLLSYRAIAYERFAKEAQWRATEIQRDMDRGHPFWRQEAIQQMLHLNLTGIRRGMNDIVLTKAEFDKRLVSGNREGFHWLAVRFDVVLPFVASTAFHPEYDLDGAPLQRLARGDARFEHVALNVTAYKGRTVAIFGWIADAGGPANLFVESYDRVPGAEKADALLQLLLVQSDNVYLRPSWWEAVPADKQKEMAGLIMAGTHVRARAGADLVDDGTRTFSAHVAERAAG